MFDWTWMTEWLSLQKLFQEWIFKLYIIHQNQITISVPLVLCFFTIYKLFEIFGQIYDSILRLFDYSLRLDYWSGICMTIDQISLVIAHGDWIEDRSFKLSDYSDTIGIKQWREWWGISGQESLCCWWWIKLLQGVSYFWFISLLSFFIFMSTNSINKLTYRPLIISYFVTLFT